MSTSVSRVRVWPGLLRLIHWVMALAVLILLLSGAVMKSGLVLSEALYQLLRDQLHLPAGHLLGVALVIRGYLLARDRGVSGLNALLPKASSLPGIKAGLRFYASFARAPLPRYYAHHPVWAPVYLLWFGLLLLEVGTGLLLEFSALRGPLGLSSQRLLEWHLAPFTLMTALVILHLVSVVLHDLKGAGSDVSGMINGYRTFATGEVPPATGLTSPTVSIGDSSGWRPRDRGNQG